MSNRVQEDRFRAILTEYEGPLRRLVSAYERDIDQQNDLVQEITFAIWRAFPSFRGESSERTFIYRIAHNRALTHIAKRHPEQLELSMALELPDISPNPEQIAMLRWQKTEVRARFSGSPANAASGCDSCIGRAVKR